MRLGALDLSIVALFLAAAFAIGAASARRAGRDTESFFLSGRRMPWWLLGLSMVATTFSTDTPNLVTDLVRRHGVAGNWVWWAFLLTGMLTTFVFARLWRRSGVLTDLEFYEIRYSGRAATVLRGFRALYLGIVVNVLIMGAVSLAAVKIGAVLLGWSPLTTLLGAMTLTALFSALGGFRGVVLSDLLLFVTAMVGAVVAAVVALSRPEVGGLSGLIAHPALSDKLRLVPELGLPGSAGWPLLFATFLVPLAVQWWAAWYPGSEPGGGGYVAQRMLAARDERHAALASLLFSGVHYAMRPWPWILVALASLIVFPDLDALAARFPEVPADKIGHDLAYPAMLTFLPAGWLGLVVASLAAAYVSTISTHLNWGASYLVHDVWRRFVRPSASEREGVFVGRLVTVASMALAGAFALALGSALEAFAILLQVGAGTGLLYVLRWLWWRINAWSEIAAMTASVVVAIYLQLIHPRAFPALALDTSSAFLLGVAVTTLVWLVVTLATPPTERAVLEGFVRRVRPIGPGWRRILHGAGDPGALPAALAASALGSLAVFGVLLGTGLLLYGRLGGAAALFGLAVVSALPLPRLWRRLSNAPQEDPS